MTLKEKIILVAIIGLLIAGLFWTPPSKAQDYDVIEGHENQIAFMENAMQTGAQLDPTPYFSYIQLALMTGNQEVVKDLGLKFAHCHILWKNAVEQKLYTQYVGEEEYVISAERALRVTQMFVYLGGGDPRMVEPILIPGLIDAGLVVDAGTVAECTALDGAATLIFDEAEEPEVPESEKQPEFSS